MKILIIEDEKVLLSSLYEAFTKAAFNVIVAENGRDGLSKAISAHPDLILLDITLPEMSGMEVLEKLRNDSWGNAVPVFILTNNTSTSYMEKALGNNSFEYLVKTDWTLDEIVRKVKGKLDEQSRKKS